MVGSEARVALTFGIQTVLNKPWPELAASWGAYEAMGFDSLWLPDHLVPPFNPSGPLFEAWTALAGLATVTSRVRLGVLVSSNTFRHPALLAKQAITVDHLSGGRLELGLGAGWFAPEHQMFGIPFPEPPVLVSQFREAVEMIDLFLRQDQTTYKGTHYQLDDAPRRPAALQQPRPPLVLGANGKRMLEIVAAHADVWNSIGTPAEIRERNQYLDEACFKASRDPATIRRSLLYVPALLADEHPWESEHLFRDFVTRFAAVGITEFIFQPPATGGEGVARIAAEVIPGLRAGALR